jgi:hypothetical protein
VLHLHNPDRVPKVTRERKVSQSSRSEPWASLTAKPSSFAKESGLVQRISKKFSPEGFLLAML